MMRSLYSGVSGLKNHQTRMDVIGNNIANVNTAGFKASRVVFQDIFSQTSSNAGSPSGVSGGTNPVQIGLGVSLAAIDVLHTSAAFQRTDNPTDLAIEGDGYFVVQIPDGSYRYTRAGNFSVDAAGNLVNANGYFVVGVMGEGTYDTTTGAILTWVEPNVNTDASKGTVDYAGGLLWDSDTSNTNPMETINLKGFKNIAIEEGTGIIRGVYYTTDATSGEQVENKVIIGSIAVATFENPNGLEKVGSSLYNYSANTGTPQFYLAQNGGAGEVLTGGLEMSNVDLSTEFTDMIVTQRGFQANSRVITVSDTLLEELINLKR